VAPAAHDGTVSCWRFKLLGARPAGGAMPQPMLIPLRITGEVPLLAPEPLALPEPDALPELPEPVPVDEMPDAVPVPAPLAPVEAPEEPPLVAPDVRVPLAEPEEVPLATPEEPLALPEDVPLATPDCVPLPALEPVAVDVPEDGIEPPPGVLLQAQNPIARKAPQPYVRIFWDFCIFSSPRPRASSRFAPPDP
jgi:hypothetical protein